jgi:hypothetical protein
MSSWPGQLPSCFSVAHAPLAAQMPPQLTAQDPQSAMVELSAGHLEESVSISK